MRGKARRQGDTTEGKQTHTVTREREGREWRYQRDGREGGMAGGHVKSIHDCRCHNYLREYQLGRLDL